MLLRNPIFCRSKQPTTIGTTLQVKIFDRSVVFNHSSWFSRSSDQKNMDPETDRQEREDSLIRQLSSLDVKIKQIKKITNLPPNVRAKIEALKKVQLDQLDREVEFHRKVHELEVTFQQRYADINDKRRQIVDGTYVPRKEDLPVGFPEVEGDQTSGIPEFWLTVFKMTPVLQTMIREADEPALKRLVDVRAVVRNDPQPGFELEFEFEPNVYFNDRVLKKQYLMKCAPNPENPFLFGGYEIYDTVGHEIDWKEGACLTTLTETDETGQKRHLMTNSFFNFFNPKKLFEKTDPVLSIQFLETDFEIGYYIKERIIPRAILFFTGEANDDLDDPDSDEEEDDDDGEKLTVSEEDSK